MLGVFLLEDWKIRGRFSSGNSIQVFHDLTLEKKIRLFQKTISKPGCYNLMFKLLKMIAVLQ